MYYKISTNIANYKINNYYTKYSNNNNYCIKMSIKPLYSRHSEITGIKLCNKLLSTCIILKSFN